MSILIVGGNRGIGLALVEELSARDPSATIFATARNPSDSPEINELAEKSNGKIVVVKLDIVDEASVQAAVAEVKKHTETLDYLYINAGAVVGGGPVSELSAADLTENFTTNVVGPHNVMKAFSPLVVASKASKRVIAVTSSLVGSITALPNWAAFIRDAYSVDHIPMTGYAVSKAAVNSLARNWADALEPQGVAVVAVHPGAVATRMGGGMKGAISPAESAKGYADIIDKLDISKTSDGIYSYDQSVAPW